MYEYIFPLIGLICLSVGVIGVWRCFLWLKWWKNHDHLDMTMTSKQYWEVRAQKLQVTFLWATLAVAGLVLLVASAFRFLS